MPLRRKEDRVTFSWLGRGRRGAKRVWGVRVGEERNSNKAE